MNTDHEKLKVVAEAANAVTSDVNITMAVGATPEEVKAVQDFLQLAMPKTVLALLAEVERLGKFEDWFVRLDQADQALAASFKAERDILKVKIYALRKDAERYRWLRARDLDTISQGGVFAGTTPANLVLNEETLDKAVDDAIAQEGAR